MMLRNLFEGERVRLQLRMRLRWRAMQGVGGSWISSTAPTRAQQQG